MFLASAELAAVSAITGKLPTPKEYLEVWKLRESVPMFNGFCLVLEKGQFHRKGHLSLFEFQWNGRLHQESGGKCASKGLK